MDYFEGTLADLLLEKYGGEEVYGESIKVIERLLGTKAEEITFVTSDDEFEKVELLSHFVFKNNETNYDLCEENLFLFTKYGFKFLYEYAEGGLITFFIKIVDKELFEALIKSL